MTLEIKQNTSGDQVISVSDTGPGIPAEEIPKVLQAFGQGSLAHTSTEGGTGLGLPIVRSLVELHGGEFELLSELRAGTIARATIPNARVLTPLRPLQPLGHERHRSNTPEALELERPVKRPELNRHPIREVGAV